MASTTCPVMFLLFGFLVNILFVHVHVHGQMQFNGTCNNVTTQPMFNLTKYLGKWYEMEKYPTIFQAGGSCLSVNYSQKNGSTEVQNTMLLHGHNITIMGTVQEINPGIHDGKLRLNFPDIRNANSEYWVLGTDYNTYSVMWYCMQINNNTNEQYAWILSRTKNETELQRHEVFKVLQTNKLDIDRFMKVNQTHCTEKGHKKGSASSARVSLTLLFVVPLLFLKNIF